MEVATVWGLLFHQDAAAFWDGDTWTVAQRLASLEVADRLVEQVKSRG